MDKSRFFLTVLLFFLLQFPAMGEKIDIDLTKEVWYSKLGFSPQDIYGNFFTKENKIKENSFPLLLNRIHKTPISQNMNSFALGCNVHLSGLSEKTSLKENIAVFLPGIGEKWKLFINGEKIADYFGNQKSIHYQKNKIISIPASLLLRENKFVFHIQGYAPSSILSDNILLGLNFKTQYRIQPESILHENNHDFLLYMLIGVYLFFGLYHIFFFIRKRTIWHNLFLGLFSLSLAFFFLSFSTLTFHFIQDTRWLIFTKYISQPLSLAFILLFFHHYFLPRKKLSIVEKILIKINFVLTLCFLLLPYSFYQTILMVWYIAGIPQLIFIIYFITKMIINKKRDALWMALSITVILIVVV